MSKCAVCGVPVDKWILFKPSNVAAYLCMTHLKLHKHAGNPPIEKWIKDQKVVIEYLEKFKNAQREVNEIQKH